MQWLDYILELLQSSPFVFWVLLPAGAGNIAPILVAKVPGLRKLSRPIHKRWFGSNKTWRGLVAGIVASTSLLWLLQQISYPLSYPPITQSFWIVGPAFGLGVLLGDMVESLVKRRRGIKPGMPWRPWDQIDYVIGAGVAVCWFLPLTPPQWLLGIFIYGALSFAMSALGYFMGFKSGI